jgi:hypothetical protein
MISPYRAEVNPTEIEFDDSVGDLMRGVGCHAVRTSIAPADPGTCEGPCTPPEVQRAQIFNQDNIRTVRGVAAPGFGMVSGETWYYSVAFETNSAYTGENSDPFFNLLFSFHPGGVGGGGNGIGSGTCCELAVNASPDGPFGHSQDGGTGRGWSDCPRSFASCLHLTFETAGGYGCTSGFDSGRHDVHFVSDPDYFVPGLRYVITVLVNWQENHTGLEEFWVNGREIARFTGISTLLCNDVAYPALENYRPSYQANPTAIKVNGGPYPATNIVWYGGMVRGSTWNAVQIPLRQGSPVNTSLPTVSGIATRGNGLRVSDGSWSNQPIRYQRQWQRCSPVVLSPTGTGQVCKDILGATGPSYILRRRDIGAVIQARITAVDRAGSSVITSVSSATVR